MNGPKVSIVDVSGEPTPSLAGQSGVNSQLSSIASGLHGSCQETTLRDDPKLASFEWKCGSRVDAVTFDLSTGKRLALSDLFQGSYASYLMSTATLQFQQAGVSKPSVGDLSDWALTPSELQIVFPSGIIDFPLATLTSYLVPGGPLT